MPRIKPLFLLLLNLIVWLLVFVVTLPVLLVLFLKRIFIKSK